VSNGVVVVDLVVVGDVVVSGSVVVCSNCVVVVCTVDICSVVDVGSIVVNVCCIVVVIVAVDEAVVLRTVVEYDIVFVVVKIEESNAFVENAVSVYDDEKSIMEDGSNGIVCPSTRINQVSMATKTSQPISGVFILALLYCDNYLKVDGYKKNKHLSLTNTLEAVEMVDDV